MIDCKDEHILNVINYPEDLRKLPQEKLGEVCEELRQYIIDILSEKPRPSGSQPRYCQRTDRRPALCLQYALRPDRLGRRTSGLWAQNPDRTQGGFPYAPEIQRNQRFPQPGRK